LQNLDAASPGCWPFTEIPGRDADRNPMVKEKVYPLTLVTRFSLDRKLSMAMRKQARDTDGVLLIRA
jgi:hypothetical protein